MRLSLQIFLLGRLSFQSQNWAIVTIAFIKTVFLRIRGVPSVLHTMYRHAAVTWCVRLPRVKRRITAILKKLKAVSTQCWLSLNWFPRCWSLFLPGNKYYLWLLSILLEDCFLFQRSHCHNSVFWGAKTSFNMYDKKYSI